MTDVAPDGAADCVTVPTQAKSEVVARADGYKPIEDYAAIGDGHALALVGLDGAIDWMCLPALDSPSVFAGLLDARDGGRFVLRPTVPYQTRRAYIERTNVLETTFQTAQGAVRVTDALILHAAQSTPWRQLVRRVEALSGSVPMAWEFEPRFDYGQRGATFERSHGVILARHEQLQLGLRAWDAGDVTVRAGAARAQFEATPGQEAMLALFASEGGPLPVFERELVERQLAETVRAWRSWIGHHSYDGPWPGAVERSLLAIGLLADRRRGAITAAGTTSLPEVVGGKRNFDYRFGWVRDCSFSVDALLRVGQEELSAASVKWLLEATAHTHPRVDPVYGLRGEVVRGQRQLDLSGYRDTDPVHLGNDAGSQLQLGGVGDLMETIWRYVRSGNVLLPEVGERLADIADLACLIWRREDAGLWELSNYAQYGTSKLSCWVALDRLIDLVRLGVAPPRNLERWRRERDLIHEFIEYRLWSDERHSYLFKAGHDGLDCGMLLAARRGYLESGAPRLNGTINAIGGELAAGDGLFYRYSGMQEQENAFLACSFWMVEALAIAGRRQEAQELMNRVVSLANDVGLFSEEMDPQTHGMRGNFPQALTHLSLITAAAILSARS